MSDVKCDISLELHEGDDTGERGRGGREGKFLLAAFLDCDHMGCWMIIWTPEMGSLTPKTLSQIPKLWFYVAWFKSY